MEDNCRKMKITVEYQGAVMAFVELSDLEKKELVPGFHGRFLHTDNMTFVYWDIAAGAVLPDHSHTHEQVVNVIEGELELKAGEEVKKMKPGQVAVIAGNVTHSAKGITDCKVIDVFYPIREDYRSGS
jgi:quercetin dioxygenase-like cupin family protein